MASLADGAFFTTINGKRCTAVPRGIDNATNSTPSVAPLRSTGAQTDDQRLLPSSLFSTSSSSQSDAPRRVVPSTPGTSSVTTSDEDVPLVSSTSDSSQDRVQNPQVTQTSTALDQISQDPLVSSSSPGGENSTPDLISDSTPVTSSPFTIISSLPPTSLLVAPISQSTETGDFDFLFSGSSGVGGASTTAAGFANDPAPSGLRPSPSDGATGASGTDRADDSTAGSGPSGSDNTGVMVGGVIGGVAAVSLAALLFWLWRRRISKNKRTLSSPHSTSRPGEKPSPSYEFDSNSVGPTSRRAKFNEMVFHKTEQFGALFNLPSMGRDRGINMNRGVSQFMDPPPAHSRANSGASNEGGAAISTKDRLLDWWSRLMEDARFNWRLPI